MLSRPPLRKYKIRQTATVNEGLAMIRRQGFSLVELLVSVAISAMVVLAMSGLMVNFMQENSIFISRTSALSDQLRISQMISNDFKSIIRLRPSEDFLVANDLRYPGAMGFSAAPPGCRFDKTGDVINTGALRATSIRKGLPAAIIYTRWNESEIATTPLVLEESTNLEFLNSLNQLNASVTPTPGLLEIVLSTPDMDTKRRYAIVNWEVRETNINPRTGTPEVIAGAERIFRMIELTLQRPLNANGTQLDIQPTEFSTDSELFLTQTGIYCIHDSSGDLVFQPEVSQGTLPPPRVLVSNQNYEVRQAQFAYLPFFATGLQPSQSSRISWGWDSNSHANLLKYNTVLVAATDLLGSAKQVRDCFAGIQLALLLRDRATETRGLNDGEGINQRSLASISSSVSQINQSFVNYGGKGGVEVLIQGNSYKAGTIRLAQTSVLSQFIPDIPLFCATPVAQ